MLIAGIDLETTGLEIGDHRIIEVYVGLWDSTQRMRRMEPLNLRIHPQRTIMPAAQAVHRISIQDLQGCPIWDRSVAQMVWNGIAAADVVVAHNGEGFDLPFLNYEFKRVGVPEVSTPMFDTMLNGRWATPHGKVPNLAELCFACGVNYDVSRAHAADYDVERMMECLFKGADWGFYELPAIANPKQILSEAA
jgi:DNA polymerase III subunit epsilon